jgi:hypothetical protein
VSEAQAQDASRHWTLARHFVRLVYPFLHDLHRSSPPQARRALLDQRWQHWWAALGDDELLRTLDSTYFFLPYVREEVLFPETARFDADEPRSQVPQARVAAQQPPSAFLPSLSDDRVVHLRLTAAALAEVAHGTLRQEWAGRVDFQGLLRLRAVDALLFPGGVGFLVLEVHADRDGLTARDLNDYLYHLRQVHAPRIEWTLPTWRFAAPTAADAGAPPTECTARDLIDYLLEGLASLPTPDARSATLADFLRPGPPKPRWTASREGQVYGQYFRLFVYATLSKAPADEPPEPGDQPPSWQRLGFESPHQLALFELATVSALGDADREPHPAGVRAILDDHLVALWAGWQALVLRDNVVFLGFTPSPFNLGVLSGNVESDYFHLYLLALYQKVRLSLLQGELIRRDSRLLESAKGARALWREFVLFTNRFWFSEVTDRQQGSVLYRHFQRGLETRALYEEVRAEARDLEKYYSDREQQWTNSLLFAITFFGLPIGVVVGLFGNAFFEVSSSGTGGPRIQHPALPDLLLFLAWLVGALALSFLIYGAWYLRRRRERR